MAGLVGAALASVYRRVVARRNRRFDAGKGVLHFDRPVVSVGNLSVGGTGKTPMVMHIVRLLLGAGRRPCIAMRGYGGGSRGGLQSDEAGVYRRAFPDLPIVAQPDRASGLIELFGTDEGTPIDCVVLDDGFQHRRVARQFDIVLMDATRPAFEDKLLPAGWLREPLSSLKRAHAAVISHAEAVTKSDAIDLETRLWNFFPNGVVAVCRHGWTSLTVAAPGSTLVEREEPVSWLRGKRVGVACAIGNPLAFLAEAGRAVGREGEVCCELVLRDHNEYEPPILARLLSTLAETRADALLVTDKDWSKLQRVRPDAWPCPVARPRLELQFDRQQAEFEAAVLEAVDAFDPDAP